MKKTLASIILLIVLTFPIHVRAAGLPVVDWSALIQRVLQTSQRLAQWYQYIEKFKKFNNEFKRYKYAFMTVYHGFKDFDSLNDIFLNIDNIDQFLKMVYHDQGKIDTWSDIFIEGRKLEDKYRGIEDNEYLTKNALYKNPYVKNYVDNKIERNAEVITEIRGGIELAKSYRKTEEKILNKIKLLQDKLTEYSSEGAGGGDTTLTAGFGKILYINGMIRLENLRLEAEMASLIRRGFERELKIAAEEMAAGAAEGRAAADEIKNIEEINK